MVARAPLAQPPDFSLRPPIRGRHGRKKERSANRLKELLVGGRSGAGFSSGRSQGELVILTKAGADKADPTSGVRWTRRRRP